jgi:Na+-driven multidrug efflux pump
MEIFGFGLTGIWIGITISACLRSIWSYIWYLFTERKKINTGKLSEINIVDKIND